MAASPHQLLHAHSTQLHTASLQTKQILLFRHHKLHNTFNTWRHPSQRLHIKQQYKSKTCRDGRIFHFHNRGHQAARTPQISTLPAPQKLGFGTTPHRPTHAQRMSSWHHKLPTEQMNSALLNTASLPTRQIPLFKHHQLRNTFNKKGPPSQQMPMKQQYKVNA